MTQRAAGVGGLLGGSGLLSGGLFGLGLGLLPVGIFFFGFAGGFIGPVAFGVALDAFGRENPSGWTAGFVALAFGVGIGRWAIGRSGKLSTPAS